MLLDDEFELMVTTEERVKKLGFRPQKEILTNHLLPYADVLDEESNRFLVQVKTNLAKAVMLREMKPACGVWTSRLMKYIRIYGLKFSKEDHLNFIKLAYELVLIPDLEPCKIHKFTTLFIMLIKKRHLIKPEELTLPWRPLYELGKTLFDKNSTQIGMYHYLTPKRSGKQGASVIDMVRKFLSGYGLDDALELFGLASPTEDEPTSLEGSYLSMVKCARPYFDVGATKEMLEEFLPYMNPWSSSSHMNGPLVFLPVGLNPRYASQGHELWFDKLNTLWDTSANSHCGVTDIMILFANLAKRNPGAVDWSPHAPKMFMRFLHALNLPVSYKDMHHNKHNNLDMKYVASWIVWTINPDGVVMKHLRSFLAGVESYLHSANAGRWSYKLRDLLKKLAREFLNRVRRESEKKYLESWENKTPDAYKLREEDITEFVQLVLEPTYQAVYTRSGILDVSVALQNLATLRPAIVIPPLLEKLKTALTSLTEPHRVTAAMSAVAAVARPMLRGADAGYPEGQTHVVPILMAVLPGLDPNDIKKTIVTLHLILMFSSMISYIDCSSAHEHWSDLTEEELLTCESTAQLEDFVLVFLDKLLTIIESSTMEVARLDTKDSDWIRSKTDAVMETAISSAVQSVLMQCSPKIFKEALRKFKAFATESTYETNVSGSMIGVLLKSFARIDAEATLAAFIPQLSEELLELLSTEEALHEENPPRDLVYRLVLFMQVVCCDGTVLLKYIPQILPVLDKALKLHSTYALTRASDCLANIFNSLAYIDLKEGRCSPKDYGSAPEKWLPIREWGSGCLMQDANFKWHVPCKEEAECAQMLVERYMKPEITRLKQWLNDERPMCRERRLRSLNIINSVLSCSTLLPPPNEEPVPLLESHVPATNMPYSNGVKFSVTLDGMNLRATLTRLLVDVQARMLTGKTDDTRGLEMLLQVWERVIVMKNLRNGPSLETLMRSYGALDRALEGRGGLGGGTVKSGGARLRMLLADAARLQDDSRLNLVCDSGMTPSALLGLNALYELSINTYSSVRIAAQLRLYWMLSHYAYSYRVLVPKIVELFNTIGEGDEWHEKHKGALCILLGPKAGPILAKQDWEVVRALWPAMLKAPVSEKQSIHRLEQGFSDSLHRHFPATNTRLTITDACIDTAKLLLTKEQFNDPEFQSLFSRAKEIEEALSDRAEKLYLELINEMVDIAESSNGQWRRLELTMQMLTFCPSLQTPYPPRAVKLFVKSLVHENITVRRIAGRLTLYAIKQRKRKVKKINVDPYEVAGVPKPETHIPGYRKDLEWALWSPDRELKTDEEWDKPWLRNFSCGFYTWPKYIKVAAPQKEQNFALDTNPEDMEEGERYLFEFFIDEQNINKLVNFLTVEEKKGKDKFNVTRSTVFRMIFANFGERVCTKLMEHALACAGKPDETMQRFAAEVASAALRAPRDWPRERALPLQRDAMNIVVVGLTAVIPDSTEDWNTCIVNAVEKMDPTRNTEVLKSLLQLCAPSLGDSTDQETSFVACARLYALQDAINAFSWRVPAYSAELLKRLEAANFMQHPYQNVRENVGVAFLAIFNTDVKFPGGENKYSPKLGDFLDSIKPKLAALYDEHGDIVIKSAANMTEQCSSACTPQASDGPRDTTLVQQLQGLVEAHRGPHDDRPQTSDASAVLKDVLAGESPVDVQLSARLEGALRLSGDGNSSTQVDHENAVNLLTTVLRGCMTLVVRGAGRARRLHALAGAACALASRGGARPLDELPRAAAAFLAALALAPHPRDAFDTALDELERMAHGRSWSARLACLELAVPLLFYGLPMLCDKQESAVRAENFALGLMRDSRVEVRQSAAKLLTGLMHCRALPDEDKTLRSLIKSCRSKELRERHCGVLGLCAYLSSRPYSLGPKLGDVLTELARHTNAPDPIPATIRTALADFRRTHQDDWPKHREQLTEEELDLLADLTSPPSYCA
ncbi:proteasome activator complex subunit 4-like [Colias croceus]|uniref:proteasome activator complex subunit 4-like n=1 Tax=Colias crocea TaxID=72248 RepID=UPI001E27AB1D|nr:proteasome activator complex subunit 4-like [Colias croceus]